MSYPIFLAKIDPIMAIITLSSASRSTAVSAHSQPFTTIHNLSQPFSCYCWWVALLQAVSFAWIRTLLIPKWEGD